MGHQNVHICDVSWKFYYKTDHTIACFNDRVLPGKWLDAVEQGARLVLKHDGEERAREYFRRFRLYFLRAHRYPEAAHIRGMEQDVLGT